MDNKNKYSACEGCHYWRDIHVCYACHYLLVTGKRRGCEAGEGCIRRKPMDEELMKRENRRIYSQGMQSDGEE